MRSRCACTSSTGDSCRVATRCAAEATELKVRGSLAGEALSARRVLKGVLLVAKLQQAVCHTGAEPLSSGIRSEPACGIRWAVHAVVPSAADGEVVPCDRTATASAFLPLPRAWARVSTC